MRKKTLLGTLIIVSVLIISCIPTILAESQTPDQPEEDCWVVTNDIVDPKIDEHNFFDEYTYPSVEAIENEQVWYKEYREPYPISNDNEWIYTTVECEAVTSGSNAILYVTTEGIVNGVGYEYTSELLTWTIINGAYKGYFEVTVTWYRWINEFGFPQYCQESETIYPGQSSKTITLYYTQALDLEFEFAVTGDDPGQKYYWIETDYDSNPGADAQWNVLDDGNVEWGPTAIGPVEQAWWTDYSGPTLPISTDPPYGFKINTKCLVWAESINEDTDAIIHVQTYGQSNYFPEMVNWTVEGAGLGEYLDGYFTLEFDVDEEPGLSDWNTNVVIDADPLFMEIGNLDHNYLNLEYFTGE